MIIVALCTKMQPPPKMCRHNILISHTSKCKRTLVSATTIICVDTQNRKLPLGAHLSFAIFKELCFAKFEEALYFTSVSNIFLWTFASIMEVGG